jgi:hypothetical protein
MIYSSRHPETILLDGKYKEGEIQWVKVKKSPST